MKILRDEMLVKADLADNNNKFYRIFYGDDFSVQVINGRIGSDGQKQKPKPFSSEAGANHFVDSKIREKIRGGYQAFQGVATTESAKGASRLDLEMAASEQIRTRDKVEVSDLIRRLVKANVHSILNTTDMKYDEATGVFQTPLGIVTQVTIDEARILLQKISTHVQVKDFSSDEIQQLLASYLMLIPQKVGRKLSVEGVIPDMEAVDKQNGILDDLESSIVQIAELRKQQALADQKGGGREIEKIFSCELNIVRDPKVLREIQEFFAKGAKSMHDSYGFKIKTVYELTIDSMTKAFEESGSLVGNIKRMWHGTRQGNLLSILKSGIIIPTTHSNGSLFGRGIYGSYESTKSLNYSTGWWAGVSESSCFMFLIDMALGRTYVPNRTNEDLPKPGTDSTTAVPGVSGIKNSELIVYRTSQVCPRFLIEFER